MPAAAAQHVSTDAAARFAVHVAQICKQHHTASHDTAFTEFHRDPLNQIAVHDQH